MLRREFLLLGTVACASVNAAGAYPTIVVDEAHIVFSRPDGSEPPPYVIAAAKAIVVVASNYRFEVPKEYGVAGPNAIHLLKGQDEKYKSAWRGYDERHELSESTLRPHAGSVPFRGFAKGETAMIAIGFDHTGITPGKDNVLSAMWLGLIKVR
jgi:hypothetical protein